MNKYKALIALVSSVVLCGCAAGVVDVSTEQTTTEQTTTEQKTTEQTTTEQASTEQVTTEQATTEQTEAETNYTVEETTDWSPEQLLSGLKTVIECDNRYNARIDSAEDAWGIIARYGERQREGYDNQSVSEIELKMEKEFGIAAVNLGEMDIETAEDIYSAFSYMYSAYPELYGTLTDITLGNFNYGVTAITRDYEFVTVDFGTPIVVKREIVLGASSFLKRDKLLENCKYQEETGFWPSNASISMIVVHELGHHLLGVHTAEHFGFSGCYVTDDNYDEYRQYTNDSLAVNQLIPQQLLDSAYEIWKEDNEGSKEDFRGSISGYALGTQSDGGISYTETVAEAVADVYANGDNAAKASKLIVEEVKKL